MSSDDNKADPAVCEALRAWRNERGLTVRDAAQMAAISSSHWGEIEMRKKVPSSGVARALFEVTGIPVERWYTPAERRRLESVQASRAESAIGHTSNDFVWPRDSRVGAGV